MALWDLWKKGFDSWEDSTARYLESVLKSPLLLAPSGAALSALMRARAQGERMIAQAWGAAGLPTKRDQERTLHLLNRLESRLADLEQKLDDLAEKQK